MSFVRRPNKSRSRKAADAIQAANSTEDRAPDLTPGQHAAAKADREAGDRAAETETIESWERLILESTDLEAFPDHWLPLFSGRSLNGWFVERGDENAWRVEAGALVARDDPGAAKSGFLLTEREFRDFLLAFEFQLDDAGNSTPLRTARP